MTIAVAQALLEMCPGKTKEETQNRPVLSMQTWGRRYPHAGYGSYGNGSAMRVFSAGWLFDTLEETECMTQCSAGVTHNHPEGIRGAVVTAGCIYLGRTGASKEQIRAYAKKHGGGLFRTCDKIRPTYYQVESCRGTVPEDAALLNDLLDYWIAQAGGNNGTSSVHAG
ncbi:MAG: ADP-ribosylglycohydrolase family protein [Lachnospiraceae bacterium]